MRERLIERLERLTRQIEEEVGDPGFDDASGSKMRWARELDEVVKVMRAGEVIA